MSNSSLAGSIQDGLIHVATFLLFGLTVLILAGILFRELNMYMAWRAELAQIFLAVIVFLLIGISRARREEIKVEVFKERDPRFEWFVRRLDLLVGFLMSVLFLYSLLKLFEVGSGSETTAGFPITIFYIGPLVGIGLLLLVYLNEIRELGRRNV
jgi:TRAP-type C4-dicarboxylate transport system permease small subunit